MLLSRTSAGTALPYSFAKMKRLTMFSLPLLPTFGTSNPSKPEAKSRRETRERRQDSASQFDKPHFATSWRRSISFICATEISK